MRQVTNLSLTPPSVRVSIQLLTDLENFFLNEVPGILQLDEGIVKERYYVQIEEPNIKYEFESITDYHYQLLPSKTVKVSQGFSIDDWTLRRETGSQTANSYKVNVYFSKSKFYSEIRISITENTTSAIEDTIKKRLLDILSHHKTLNSYFFAPIWLKTFVTTWFIIQFILDRYHVFNNPKLGVLTIIVGLLIIPDIKPYSHFDTQQNNFREKAVNYLLLAPISAIIGLLVNMFFGK